MGNEGGPDGVKNSRKRRKKRGIESQKKKRKKKRRRQVERNIYMYLYNIYIICVIHMYREKETDIGRDGDRHR